jgi:UDP-N-acetylmuramate--alanine ligase
VIEADEYDNMFLGLKPQIEVVTSLEHDHPDFFPTFASMVESFQKFVDLLPDDGTFIACMQDTGAMELVSYARKAAKNIVGYGVQDEATITTPLWVMARDVEPNQRGGFDFVATSNLSNTGFDPVVVSLQVPGEHNVRNALAVLTIIDVLGLSRDKAALALSKFTGTGRRFQ